MIRPASRLERDLEYFRRHRKAWLKRGHTFKWFLVARGGLVGRFDTAEAAYRRALEDLEPGGFVLKQLLPEEPRESIPALLLGILGPPR